MSTETILFIGGPADGTLHPAPSLPCCELELENGEVHHYWRITVPSGRHEGQLVYIHRSLVDALHGTALAGGDVRARIGEWLP